MFTPTERSYYIGRRIVFHEEAVRPLHTAASSLVEFANNTTSFRGRLSPLAGRTFPFSTRSRCEAPRRHRHGGPSLPIPPCVHLRIGRSGRRRLEGMKKGIRHLALGISHQPASLHPAWHMADPFLPAPCLRPLVPSCLSASVPHPRSFPATTGRGFTLRAFVPSRSDVLCFDQPRPLVAALHFMPRFLRPSHFPPWPSAFQSPPNHLCSSVSICGYFLESARLGPSGHT